MARKQHLVAKYKLGSFKAELILKSRLHEGSCGIIGFIIDYNNKLSTVYDEVLFKCVNLD